MGEKAQKRGKGEAAEHAKKVHRRQPKANVPKPAAPLKDTARDKPPAKTPNASADALVADVPAVPALAPVAPEILDAPPEVRAAATAPLSDQPAEKPPTPAAKSVPDPLLMEIALQVHAAEQGRVLVESEEAQERRDEAKEVETFGSSKGTPLIVFRDSILGELREPEEGDLKTLAHLNEAKAALDGAPTGEPGSREVLAREILTMSYERALQDYNEELFYFLMDRVQTARDRTTHELGLATREAKAVEAKVEGYTEEDVKQYWIKAASGFEQMFIFERAAFEKTKNSGLRLLDEGADSLDFAGEDAEQEQKETSHGAKHIGRISGNVFIQHALDDGEAAITYYEKAGCHREANAVRMEFIKLLASVIRDAYGGKHYFSTSRRLEELSNLFERLDYYEHNPSHVTEDHFERAGDKSYLQKAMDTIEWARKTVTQSLEWSRRKLAKLREEEKRLKHEIEFIEETSNDVNQIEEVDKKGESLKRVQKRIKETEERERAEVQLAARYADEQKRLEEKSDERQTILFLQEGKLKEAWEEAARVIDDSDGIMKECQASGDRDGQVRMAYRLKKFTDGRRRIGDMIRDGTATPQLIEAVIMDLKAH